MYGSYNGRMQTRHVISVRKSSRSVMEFRRRVMTPSERWAGRSSREDEPMVACSVVLGLIVHGVYFRPSRTWKKP